MRFALVRMQLHHLMRPNVLGTAVKLVVRGHIVVVNSMGRLGRCRANASEDEFLDASCILI